MRPYQETIEYIYNLQYSGIKLGLDNIKALLKFWGNPQNTWPAIHIAGTNGKGSTAAAIFSILKSAGYRVGLYTSPHLIDFNERIRVNDQKISWQQIVDYTETLRPKIEEIKPTFFEATSAIAFKYFADQKIDIAVIETGLGGRLDATNLVNPIASVITPIAMDHSQFLGETISEIAAEKAGIIKSQVPCITANRDETILNILKNYCRDKNSELIQSPKDEDIIISQSDLAGSRFSLQTANQYFQNLSIPIAGKHQVNNAALAVTTLLNCKLNITENHIRQGLTKINWPARLELIQKSPLTVLDVAHNPHGFKHVFDFFNLHYPGKNIWVLTGLSWDKDYKKIADILNNNVCSVGIIKDFSDKSLSGSKFKNSLDSQNLQVYEFEKMEEGYGIFLEKIPKEDLLLVIGSHYLAEKFYKITKNLI